MTEQQALKRKKIKIWIRISIGIVLMILGAYHFYQAYQTKYYYMAQNYNDAVNPTGTRAVCIIVSDDLKNGTYLPYTIKYLPKEDEITDLNDPTPEVYNYRTNLRLSAFAQVGLLSEEKVGEDEQGRPIYRYDLTDKGREYIYWHRGMNFCFGKVIVEKRTMSVQDYVFPNEKEVFYDFHYENVPDWVEVDVIKNLNTIDYEGYRDALYKGKGRGGIIYKVNSSDDWRPYTGTSGLTVPQ